MLQLYPYQEEGVRFLMEKPDALNRKPHRYLADEQGLGKTIQAIEAAKRLKLKNGIIICPVQVKYNWARQMVKWGLCQEDQIQVINSLSDEPDRTRPWKIINYDLIALTGIIHPLSKMLFCCDYEVAIVDEAHRLKSVDATRTQKILGKDGILGNCYRKWLMSGTPFPNRPIEMYPILASLAPELIAPHNSYGKFGIYFCQGYYDQASREWNFKGANHVDELRERMRPLVLRREVADVHGQLPPVTLSYRYVDVKEKMLAHPEVVALGQDDLMAFEGSFDPETQLPGPTLRRIIAESKTLDAIDIINDTMADNPDAKIAVFAYHTKVIDDLLEQFMGVHPVCVRGGVTAKQKQQAVDDFRRPENRLFIGQIISASEGIDGLQEVCNRVIFVELDWSAGAMAQALSRLHRIGQTKPVFATYIVGQGTMEEAIVRVLDKKQKVISQLIHVTNKTEGTQMTIEQKLDKLISLQEETLAVLKGSGSTNVSTAPAKTTKEEADKVPKEPTAAAAPAEKPKGRGGRPPKAPKVAFPDVQAAVSAHLNKFEKGSEEQVNARNEIADWLETNVGEGAKLAQLEQQPELFEPFLNFIADGATDQTQADDPLAGI